MRALLECLHGFRNGNRTVFQRVHLVDRMVEDRLSVVRFHFGRFRGGNDLADDLGHLADAGRGLLHQTCGRRDRLALSRRGLCDLFDRLCSVFRRLCCLFGVLRQIGGRCGDFPCCITYLPNELAQVLRHIAEGVVECPNLIRTVKRLRHAAQIAARNIRGKLREVLNRNGDETRDIEENCREQNECRNRNAHAERVPIQTRRPAPQRRSCPSCSGSM